MRKELKKRVLGEVTSFAGERLTTTEVCLSLSPEDGVREFLSEWSDRI